MRAIVFDFDGLILDTETPDFRAWQEVYEAHGRSLTLEEWAAAVGSLGGFDPYATLERRVGRALDWDRIDEARRTRFSELMSDARPMPGVEALLIEAREAGLGLAVASSSTRAWVSGYLERFGLGLSFDRLSCRDDVVSVKPDPALYLGALRALGVEAREAMAIEDSPNGILAAKRAGLVCVAVPNALTRRLALGEPDVVLDSLEGVTLQSLMSLVRRSSPAV